MLSVELSQCLSHFPLSSPTLRSKYKTRDCQVCRGLCRYYSKQLRDDKLKQRRARVAGDKRREEEERLRHFGLVRDHEEEPSSLVEMIRNERTAAVFRSPSSLVHTQSPSSPSTTLL